MISETEQLREVLLLLLQNPLNANTFKELKLLEDNVEQTILKEEAFMKASSESNATNADVERRSINQTNEVG